MTEFDRIHAALPHDLTDEAVREWNGETCGESVPFQGRRDRRRNKPDEEPDNEQTQGFRP